ncbi:hypothetical protein NPIL_596171 [Nephila pilipes]|uniref:CCHC-type domain-containing protein n=1 Tax=Nephila pilipes TaxID=299642 RepID=A0A8X6N5M3_NEPPI|nr:hypothetical protein NPIL_596171 [Nephila pilipes]
MLRKCYKCHKLGHFARNCSAGGDGRGGGYRGNSRSSYRVSCYNCDRSGHYAGECPIRLAKFVERLVTSAENASKMTEE